MKTNATIPLVVPFALLCVFFFGVAGGEKIEATGHSRSNGSPTVSTVTPATPPPVAEIDESATEYVVADLNEQTEEADETPVQSVSLKKKTVEPGYGDITGQILFDGDVPKIQLAIKAGDPTIKDAAVCAAKNLDANDMLIDPKTKGVANVFVYIYHKNIKRKGIKVHPEAAKIADDDKEIVFDQKNCRFFPHVMIVRVGQHVRVKSADNCAHNTHTTTISANEEFNTIISPNDRKGVLIDDQYIKGPESLPMPVKCDIHPWMKAHWLIINHPYAAITDKEGRFTIKNLPVGDIEFRIWHERALYIDRKYVVTVEEGQNELEPVKVPASKFEEE